MGKQELLKTGLKLLKENNLKVIYITSDGQGFDKLSNANNNAKELDDQEVLIVNADSVSDIEESSIDESKIKKTKK